MCRCVRCAPLSIISPPELNAKRGDRSESLCFPPTTARGRALARTTDRHAHTHTQHSVHKQGKMDTSAASSEQIDEAAVKEAIAALEESDGGMTRASLMVSSLSMDDTANLREQAEAMVVLSEVCARSASASSQLLEAGILSPLSDRLLPGASNPTKICQLSLRMLSAIAVHGKKHSEAICQHSVVKSLLLRTTSSFDEEICLMCASLLNSLADAPSTRMRLMHAGALTSMTHVLAGPHDSGAFKEHLLQACHSLAGVPDDELALPDLLGKVLLSKLPGNQAQALACVQLIREKQPAGSGVDGRLACCPILVQGLQAAKGSANEEVARDASSLLGAFQKARV